MTIVQDAPMLDEAKLHDALREVVDARTLEIIDRRRQTTVIKGRGWLVRRVLLAADVVGLLAATLLAEGVVAAATNTAVLQGRWEILALAASLPVWIVIAKLYGLYDNDEERADHSTADEFTAVFHMVTVCTFLLWAFAESTGVMQPQASKLLIFWFAAILLISAARALARALARRSLSYLQNTIIVGAGDTGQTIARKLLNHPEYRINLVGFVDAEPREPGPGLEHLALLGDARSLRSLIKLFEIERVIVAFSRESHEATLDLIRDLNDLYVHVDIVPRLYELIAPGMGIHTVEGLPLLGLPPNRLARSSLLLKRTMDLAVAIPALVILAPFFALTALAIKLDSRGPVFFRQVRMGARDRTFRIWKFRTMAADADERKHEVAHLNKYLQPGDDPRMFKIPDDPRITRVGQLLRRFSLDELPQLFNVLRAEMSLVGARPLILEEDELIDEWCRRRLQLKPGITGLWQVLGRNDIPFEEMLALDYRYVTRWSIFSDLSILGRTLPVVLRRGG